MKGPTLSPHGQQERLKMSKSFKGAGLAVGPLRYHLPAAAQTKVTNEGISPPRS